MGRRAGLDSVGPAASTPWGPALAQAARRLRRSSIASLHCRAGRERYPKACTGGVVRNLGDGDTRARSEVNSDRWRTPHRQRSVRLLCRPCSVRRCRPEPTRSRRSRYTRARVRDPRTCLAIRLQHEETNAELLLFLPAVRQARTYLSSRRASARLDPNLRWTVGQAQLRLREVRSVEIAAGAPNREVRGTAVRASRRLRTPLR